MKSKNILLLGSSSQSRQMLLKEALIPFKEIGHGADEEAIDKTFPFEKLLVEIARHKMNHVTVPAGKEGDICFVLTADSMGKDKYGIVHGKPKNREDALKKIKALSEKSISGTALCVHKKIFRNGVWQVEKVIEKYVETEFAFSVPDYWIDQYLEHSWAMIAAGAIAVELYGAQFLKWVNGSYSGIVGLPMFELRKSLEELGFWD